MKAGWKQILQNETLLTTHIRNANFVNPLRVSLHKFADMKTYESKHKENTPRRIWLDELAVQDLEQYLIDFECDPFDAANTKICTLHSGEYASTEMQRDFLTTYKDGEEVTKSFFKDRAFSVTVSWDHTISKNSRMTFLKSKGTSEKDTTHKLNTVVMEIEAMSRVVSECWWEDIKLEDIMKYRVTNECLSLFNTNGMIIKNQKSKLLQMLNFVEIQQSQLDQYVAEVDMGFIWRLCMPSSEDREKNDETEYTWWDYAKTIFDTVIIRHDKAKSIFLINDPYDLEESIKDGEHKRRENYAKFVHGSKNVFIKPLNKLPNSRDLSKFFTNKDIKTTESSQG